MTETFPLPNKKAIVEQLKGHFDSLTNNPIVVPTDRTLYSIEQRFGTMCNCWKGDMRPARFGRADKTYILYRSQIVDDLFAKLEETLEHKHNTGIMVKGPQGIGKSHTLVNLVLKLQSTKKYLVTFVPDCSKFESFDFLVQVICNSFGINVHGAEGMGLPDNHLCESQEKSAMFHIMDRTVDCLTAMDKKWVFVFDQVNALFAKDSCEKFSKLRHPSHYIQSVMCTGKVISIISASTDNESAFIESNFGFDDFDHAHEMSDDELRAAFYNITSHNIEVVKESAGRIPYYVNLYSTKQEKKFQETVNDEVYFSCRSMKRDTYRWSYQLESIISCVLELPPYYDRKYDRKYLTCTMLATGQCLFKPLFPAVVQAYRSVLWNEIMKYVRENEGQLMSVCRASTGRVVCQLYEEMVIQRIISSGLTVTWKGSNVHILPETCSLNRFAGKLLPPLPSSDGLWIPENSRFPAIDFFIKSGITVIAFHLHVSTLDDVTNHFFDLCVKAKWFDSIPEIGLVYLSPTAATVGLAQNLVKPTIYPSKRKRNADGVLVNGNIRRAAWTSRDINGLSSISWA